MKRLHVHMSVDDLERATEFYAGLFGAPPTERRADCAKWVLENPPVNFTVVLCESDGAGTDCGGAVGEIANRVKSAGDAPATEIAQSVRGERTTA
jgi:catechol 2,3-dioxygenase-like lactoylglutathione lyase family enzyme